MVPLPLLLFLAQSSKFNILTPFAICTKEYIQSSKDPLSGMRSSHMSIVEQGQNQTSCYHLLPLEELASGLSHTPVLAFVFPSILGSSRSQYKAYFMMLV